VHIQQNPQTVSNATVKNTDTQTNTRTQTQHTARTIVTSYPHFSTAVHGLTLAFSFCNTKQISNTYLHLLVTAYTCIYICMHTKSLEKKTALRRSLRTRTTRSTRHNTLRCTLYAQQQKRLNLFDQRQSHRRFIIQRGHEHTRTGN